MTNHLTDYTPIQETRPELSVSSGQRAEKALEGWIMGALPTDL